MKKLLFVTFVAFGSLFAQEVEQHKSSDAEFAGEQPGLWCDTIGMHCYKCGEGEFYRYNESLCVACADHGCSV